MMRAALIFILLSATCGFTINSHAYPITPKVNSNNFQAFINRQFTSDCQPQMQLSGPEVYSNYTYHVSNRIDVANFYRITLNSGSDIRMKAGKTIVLKPGTAVLRGNHYLARIEPCEPPCTLLPDYPRFFTPNGDGENEIWKIKNLKQEDFIALYIYDRFGKMLKSFNTFHTGWDGTYNNKPVFATDYWFLLVYKDCNGKRMQYKSHFSLLR